MPSPLIEGKNALNDFTGAMKSAMGAVQSAVGPILNTIPGVNRLVAAMKAAQDAIKPIIDGIKNTVGALIAPIAKFTAAMYQGTQASMALAGAVASMARTMAEKGASMLAAPLRVMDAGISAISSNVARFVALANPAAIFQFQYAIDSLYATIGNILVPVLGQFTNLINGIAGAINGASESGRQVIAAMAGGTAGLLAFGAAMTAITVIASGGPIGILGALAGAIVGVLLASGRLQPLFDALTTSVTAFLDQIGGALDVAVGAFAAIIPIIAQVAGGVSGFASYLIDAFERALPAIMAFGETVGAIAVPVMHVMQIISAGFIEGLLLVGKGFMFIAPAIVLVADVLGQAVKGIMSIVKQLLALIGIDIDTNFGNRGGPDSAASALEMMGTGAAKGADKAAGSAPVRAPQFGTSMEVLKQAQMNAFSIGSGGPKKDPIVDVVANTQNIAAQANEMKQQIKDLVKFIINEFPHIILDRLPLAINHILVKLWDRTKGIVEEVKEEARGRGVNLPLGLGRVEGRDIEKGVDKSTDAIGNVFNNTAEALFGPRK